MWIPAAIGGAAALAAGGFHYAALWPQSQLFGGTLIAGADAAEIAFTFDDGPNDPYTYQLLEIFARAGVRASFFMIGEFVRRRPEMARAVHQAGHVVGNHTMTHPKLMYCSPRRVREEIGGANRLLEDTLGERVEYFRPPFGARRPDVLRSARELGLTPVMWNVTGFDWNAASARVIETHVERGIVQNQNRERGTNLLLHDGGHLGAGADRKRTVSATATLVAVMPRAGMRAVGVDAWAARRQGLGVVAQDSE